MSIILMLECITGRVSGQSSGNCSSLKRQSSDEAWTILVFADDIFMLAHSPAAYRFVDVASSTGFSQGFTPGQLITT